MHEKIRGLLQENAILNDFQAEVIAKETYVKEETYSVIGCWLSTLYERLCLKELFCHMNI
jgi:hypothetical protein